jgi:DtxR family Mn-dependent transcriptional regulator
VEAALDELLGHPETCPHGNPIEEAVGARRPTGIPLCDVESGQRAIIYRITEEAEEDAGLLSYLEARGLLPGVRVTVLARSLSTDSLTLDGPIGRATMGLRPASMIQVLPPDADPALFHAVPERVVGRVAAAYDPTP